MQLQREFCNFINASTGVHLVPLVLSLRHGHPVSSYRDPLSLFANVSLCPPLCSVDVCCVSVSLSVFFSLSLDLSLSVSRRHSVAYPTLVSSGVVAFWSSSLVGGLGIRAGLKMN